MGVHRMPVVARAAVTLEVAGAIARAPHVAPALQLIARTVHRRLRVERRGEPHEDSLLARAHGDGERVGTRGAPQPYEAGDVLRARAPDLEAGEIELPVHRMLAPLERGRAVEAGQRDDR